MLDPMPTLADYPHLAAQFDRRRNGGLVPKDISYASNRKRWWRCPAGTDHVWEAVVANRTRLGVGCPFCAGRRVSITNSLLRVKPDVARQWHPTRNGALRPDGVVAGSHQVVWWTCGKGPDHEWRATVADRVRGNGCPFCARQRTSIATSLAAVHPALAREWHPTRNGVLRPVDVLPRANRSIWWKCPKGHVWSARLADRTDGNGCPFCSGHRPSPERSLAVCAPEVARTWHPTKNGRLTPRDVTFGSGRVVWWKCPKGPDHEWQSSVGARVRCTRHGCLFCSGRRVSKTNALAYRFPKLAREWHPTKNGALTPKDVTSGTHRRAWWRCVMGHAWQTTIVQRTHQGSGCPRCTLRKRTVAVKSRARSEVLLPSYDGPRSGGD